MSTFILEAFKESTGKPAQAEKVPDKTGKDTHVAG